MVIHDNEADGAGDAEQEEEGQEGDEEVVGEEEQDEDESTVYTSYVASSRWRYILPSPPLLPLAPQLPHRLLLLLLSLLLLLLRTWSALSAVVSTRRAQDRLVTSQPLFQVIMHGTKTHSYTSPKSLDS